MAVDPWANLLLYEDPDHHFVINATVRKPGSKGASTIMAIPGRSTGSSKAPSGSSDTPGWTMANAPASELKLIAEREMGPGGVDFVPPYEVHAERGGPDRSVAIIVRSERMVGRFKQHMFDTDKNTVAEAWGPEQVPYELA